MNNDDKKLLEDDGWELECESPQEIRLKDDPESFASGAAVDYIVDALREFPPIDTIVDEITDQLDNLKPDSRMEG